MSGTPKRWQRIIANLAAEFAVPNVTIEVSKHNHIKVYSGDRMICSCSSTPGDPNVIFAYRRQFRAFKQGNSK